MGTVVLPEILEPLSRDELQHMWAGLNRTYFEDRLPSIQIQWSSRLTSSAGLFVSQNGPRYRWVSPEERHGAGRVIRLSRPIHQKHALSEIRSTLAHEMIHQWQFDVKKCRPMHGSEFRRVMNVMNRDGLRVTIYHTLYKEVEVLAKYAWQCVECGRSYTRQRKTLSVKWHRCGECYGTLREINPGGRPPLVQCKQAQTSDSLINPSLSRVVPIQLSFQFST